MHLAYRTVAERVRLRLATLDRAISASVPGRIEALAVRGNALEVRARTAINSRLGHAGLRVTAADSALRILNPLRVLDRGYAIIEAPLRDGRDAGPVTRVTDLQFGDAIRLRLRDGVANATITGLAVTDADRDV
jgi:exonuclease VII large subunit